MQASELEGAYNVLAAARKALHEKTELEIMCHEILKTKESKLLVSGAIIGKNAESRDAQLKEVTQTERYALQKAEKEKREAQLALELAQDHVSLLGKEMKLLEMGITMEQMGIQEA